MKYIDDILAGIIIIPMLIIVTPIVFVLTLRAYLMSKQNKKSNDFDMQKFQEENK
jgi:hypothetical protein